MNAMFRRTSMDLLSGSHRCQPQRTKKRDRADEKALVSIFSHHQGAHLVKQQAKYTQFYQNIHDLIKWCSCITKYIVSESLMSLFVSCNDIIADIAERIGFAEHGKLVAESSEFHLTLSRAHKAHFFQLEIRKKKRDILSGKRDCAKKA